MLITILPGGKVEMLYSDIAHNVGLGVAHIERASHLEFCNKLQGWVVTIIETDEQFGPFDDRAAGLRFEVEYLEAKMKKDPGVVFERLFNDKVNRVFQAGGK